MHDKTLCEVRIMLKKLFESDVPLFMIIILLSVHTLPLAWACRVAWGLEDAGDILTVAVSNFLVGVVILPACLVLVGLFLKWLDREFKLGNMYFLGVFMTAAAKFNGSL
ncbi:hypothetical protein EUZ85_26520 [Hahella sp. KA22]|uniref:hypothetical protein n=1 Tax=Hahella sp. KA22 TaxID=1628392 RepID=UPI000FDD3FDB|nr:hypothetical protein [Hahella sp. KA22]AZZ94079.1 hypothetical protein ENC22_23935 [Hahella sp. KA22]QAY57453.1 hypothetical protein EUZ85_26520 [Hahella sp. KA22]